MGSTKLYGGEGMSLQSAEFVPFIYGLVDPLDVGHVRYVGMARVVASRPYDHAQYARENSKTNPHLMNWIRKLQSEGREYQHIVLEFLPNGSRSLLGFVEKCYIKSLREIGHGLLNVTAGGEGGDTGITPEGRAILSAKAKGNQNFLGREHTPETRAHLSAVQKGRKKSAKAIEGIKRGWLKRKRHPGVPSPLRGRKHREDSRVQMRESGKAAWADNPERRAALARRNQERSLRALEKKRQREIEKKLAASEIYEKWRASLCAAWVIRRAREALITPEQKRQQKIDKAAAIEKKLAAAKQELADALAARAALDEDQS